MMNLGAIVNYEDICIPDTRKATVIKNGKESCYIKVALFQTGYL